ncbi:hypothetical protein [Paenibacillus plantiphilus]|uniref:hypothetical protein n=1 Tax=Paenibacillus plantiphilus TaxID=2905650 RepID=UPI001F24830D|nr:hypothetical protein [Paenibacillus plantiphilus]
MVLQEEEERSIQADIEASPALKQMIEESREEYQTGKGMTTSDLFTKGIPSSMVKHKHS